MKTTHNLSLTKKLALAIVVTGIIPTAIIGFLALRTASHMAEVEFCPLAIAV